MTSFILSHMHVFNQQFWDMQFPWCHQNYYGLTNQLSKFADNLVNAQSFIQTLKSAGLSTTPHSSRLKTDHLQD